MYDTESDNSDAFVESRVPPDFEVPPLPSNWRDIWYLQTADECGLDVWEEWEKMQRFEYACFRSPAAQLENAMANAVLRSLEQTEKECSQSDTPANRPVSKSPGAALCGVGLRQFKSPLSGTDRPRTSTRVKSPVRDDENYPMLQRNPPKKRWHA